MSTFATPRAGELDELKRRSYLAALLLGLPAIALVARVEWDSGVVLRLGYPALFVALVVLGVGLWRRTLPVAVAERVVLLLVPSLWFARLVDALYVRGDLEAARDSVTVSVGPGLSIVVALLYLASEARTGLRASLAIGATFFGVVAPRAVPALADPATRPLGVDLLRMVVYTTVLGLLLYALATLKEHVARHREHAETLDLLAGTDVLTGIANRRRATEVLADHLVTAGRYDRPLAVALIDLDAFKAVNDHHGHAAGDAALRDVVAAVQRELRAPDTLARWGGDELLVIAPETSRDELVRCADRWRAGVAALDIPAGPRRLSLSVGVTERRPGDTPDGMVRRADAALYDAKGQGRDRTVPA